MFKFNSGFRWTSTNSESTTATLPFPQQNSDCDIENKEHSHFHTNDVAKSSGEQQLENVLSNLLKYGVLIASAVVLFGGIVYLVNHGTEPIEYDYFHGEPSQFCSPVGILKLLSGSDSRFDFLRDRAIIQFGLLLLIATPIIRVIISLLSFLRMRDFTYVIITSLVLSALAYSLIGAYI